VRAAAVRLADATLLGEISKLAGDPSFDVRIAVAFAVSALPGQQETVLAMARQSGANLLVRDGLLSGLRGRELETLEELLGNNDKPAPATMVRALATAVMTEKKAPRMQKLFTLIGTQPANSPTQLALLEGVSSTLPAKNARKPKMLNIKGGIPELAGLLKAAEGKAKPLVELIDARIVWEDKAGYVPPPPVVPLTAAEQKLFDGGKQVYTTLCIACHQANGQGMEGLAPTLIDSDWVTGKSDLIPRIVIHGLTGPIDVNGKTWSLEMPPLGPALNDEQVAAVTTYIRREWEHTASPVSVDEVKKIREEYKTRAKSWTAEELGMVPTKAEKKEKK
jgi:mono/diheme cytochrome c family protein